MAFVRAQRSFILPYLLFLLFGLILIISFDQKELHLLLNSFHNSFLDQLFYWVTYLGDGRILIFVPLLYFFTTVRKASYVLVSTAIASITTQLLKRLFEAPRPSKVFEDAELYIVNGMNLHKHFSFPSGHSTTAFAFFFCLSILKPKYSLLFVLLAVLSGFSRVYLSQHFLEDVIGGSLVGISGALLGLLLNRFFQREKFNKTLFGFADKL